MKIRRAGNQLLFFCPGCQSPHGPDTSWSFNGDVDRPTLRPSVLVTQPPTPMRCHSFVTDGRIEFLSDCTHSLAGQTVDLPDWPASWDVRE